MRGFLFWLIYFVYVIVSAGLATFKSALKPKNIKRKKK